MADDEIVALLREIRDLQTQQSEYLRALVANQQQALSHQQQSLANQQQSMERQRLLLAKSSRLWIFVLGGVFILLFLSLFPTFFRLLLGH